MPKRKFKYLYYRISTKNESVASINQDGLLLAKKIGTTSVVVTTKNAKTDTIVVRVTK
ncbi:MAG: Ig-like domain-containing protein [Niallia nealsonii]|uniref:Ig-like domain-containing protein n=1 Tax=Niallia circulans TaxID=1397 RepID=A0A941GLN2_NIACI|nr:MULTISPECIES: Ig-like domain-containing protein [Niallia]MCB5237327.1 Ig-like domain-containing protein [Niallia circulans]MDU1847543.1 Ig-like domain-containing protein [Niallia nealsonii]MED3793617.1 Ig-like domain-containing protein [Niallia alba]